MIGLSSSNTYYLYGESTDMRKGFGGLSGLVRDGLGKDPLSGDVFVFVNRRRNRMKLLVWDRTGFVLYYKLLERGTFELPAASGTSCRMSWQQLVLVLEGVALASVRQRKRYSLPLEKSRRFMHN